MRTRSEALTYALTFPDTYQQAPFHDPNWQLVRVKGSKKAFLWTYEKDGFINLNVKVSPAWRDFWRDAFASVIPGWHQNKDNWNTIILDGTVPDDAIKNMIADSYAIVTILPDGSMKPSNRNRKEKLPLTVRLLNSPEIKRCAVLSEMHYTKTPIHPKFLAIAS